MSEPPMELNGLPLEYERNYGTAGRDLDVSNLINNPAASGKCRVFGLGFEEQLGDVFPANLGAVLNDGANALLITDNSIESLS